MQGDLALLTVDALGSELWKGQKTNVIAKSSIVIYLPSRRSCLYLMLQKIRYCSGRLLYKRKGDAGPGQAWTEPPARKAGKIKAGKQDPCSQCAESPLLAVTLSCPCSPASSL